MVSKAQKFRLGLFLIVSTIILLIFVVSVAGNKLMEKRDEYVIHYKNVSINGLQIGGSVKYHGINIGRVDDIVIDQEDIEKINVHISVKAETPIKSDVIATLVPVGITGLMQIELFGGTNEAKTLSPGDSIKAGKSSFQNITGKAEVIAEKLEVLLNNLTVITNEENQKRFISVLENVDEMVSENRKTVHNIVSNADSTIIYLNGIASLLETTMLKINEYVYAPEMEKIIKNTEKVTNELAQVEINDLINNLNTLLSNANDAVDNINVTVLNSKQDFKVSMETLRETLIYLNEFSRRINENPAILIRSQKQ